MIKKKYFPLNSRLLANMLTQTVKKLKIVEPALNILSGDIKAVKKGVKVEFSSAIETLAVENTELKRDKLERVLRRLMVKEERYQFNVNFPQA